MNPGGRLALAVEGSPTFTRTVSQTKYRPHIASEGQLTGHAALTCRVIERFGQCPNSASVPTKNRLPGSPRASAISTGRADV